ncbi:MAG TPA: energy transducer TonB, partial [Flavobacteriales bacterium]|nr:energy transducer TonB [Flavobacteriales bacterium]
MHPILTAILLTGSLSLSAQDTLVLPPPIHLDSLPSNNGSLTRVESPGGDDALVAYLMKELRYPDNMRQAAKEGVVQVGFTITDAGAVENVRVIEGIAGAEALDAEAVRVVSAMPRWEPATVHGVTVPMEYKLPV